MLWLVFRENQICPVQGRLLEGAEKDQPLQRHLSLTLQLAWAEYSSMHAFLVPSQAWLALCHTLALSPRGLPPVIQASPPGWPGPPGYTLSNVWTVCVRLVFNHSFCETGCGQSSKTQ